MSKIRVMVVDDSVVVRRQVSDELALDSRRVRRWTQATIQPSTNAPTRRTSTARAATGGAAIVVRKSNIRHTL